MIIISDSSTSVDQLKTTNKSVLTTKTTTCSEHHAEEILLLSYCLEDFEFQALWIINVLLC